MQNDDWKQHSPLGQATDYPDQYDPRVLFAVPRTAARQALGLGDALPFFGADIWNAYELSWLGNDGKPRVAILQIIVPYDSPFIVESKSLKLYLNSFNQTVLADETALQQRIQQDLAACLGKTPQLVLLPIITTPISPMPWPGECIDALSPATLATQPSPAIFNIDTTQHGHQTLYSYLFRSLCPVTGQPDWASVWIDYHGPRLDASSVLNYLLSFRRQPGFHETCVEHIFLDIMRSCSPEKLLVYARFLRRGGIDINPWRSSDANLLPPPLVDSRQ